MRLKVFNSLMGLCVATAAVSCSDSLVDNIDSRPVGGEDSDMISFVVANNNTTRGGSFGNRPCGGAFLRNADNTDSLYMKAEVSDIDADLLTRAADITDANISSINMTCRKRNKEGISYYFADLVFNKNSENIWQSTPSYWWLDVGTNFQFYGFSPAGADGVTFKENSESDYYPTLEYTVPATVSNQSDLIYALCKDNEGKPIKDFEYLGNHNQTIPLSMNHALSKIVFKTGSGMADGTIKSVTIKNIYDKGELNLREGIWTLDYTSTNNFTLTKDRYEEDSFITENGDSSYFMLLPESNNENSVVEIVFQGKDGKSTTYVSSLKNIEPWQAGKQYTYTISINPDLTIDLVPETVDAHYVIAKAHISAPNLRPGQQWELTVSAEDGADVTVVSELSTWQQQGFWINHIVKADGTSIPARGSNIITGTTSKDLHIFIPENASENAERKITLSLRLAGSKELIDEKDFMQYHPAWVGDFGWEQTDDNKSAQFGFNWTRKVNYTYLYTGTTLSLKTKYRNYCQSVIDENNANGYATVKSFLYSSFPTFGDRYYIEINYSTLSVLNGYDYSVFDGRTNTIQLYSLAGTSTTGQFENVIKTILKTEKGHTTENAFRIGNGQPNEAPESTGENYLNAPAIGECLKKNRYYLLETTSSQGDIGYIPQLDAADIKWYLPAVDQFDNVPTTIKHKITPEDYWTSTAVTKDQTMAFLGDDSKDERVNSHKIRACRNRNKD